MPRQAKSYLKDTHPHLREEFVECIHPKTKRSIPFDDLTTQANFRCTWQCMKGPCGCSHIWITSVSNRTYKQGKNCPHCAHKLTYVCRCESFGTKFPELLKEYDPSNERDPFTLAPVSNIRVQWQCFKCAYVWQTTVGNRTCLKRNCPACAHYVPSETRNLEVCFPEIAKEFHSTKNAPLTAKTVMPGTHKIVWWHCTKHNFDWQASVANRTVGNSPGCVKCNESSLEYYMRLVLEKLLEQKVMLDLTFNTRLGDTRFRGDFVITMLNHRKLVLEMDGPQHFLPTYFRSSDPEKANECLQKTQDLDRRKREWCEANKHHLLRIAYTVPQKEWEKTVLGFMAFCAECPDTESRFAMIHTPRKNQTCDMELDD